LVGEVRLKDYLKRAYDIRLQIRSKLEQLNQLRSLVEKTTTTLSLTPKGTGDGNQLENIMVKLIDSENEIKDEIVELLDTEANVKEMINQLERADLRVVLELRYLCNYSWPKIAEEMSCDRRQATRLHGLALAALEEKGKEVVPFVPKCP
jgi:DNA-directed RNA polymerase specialized sigma subunit